MNMSSNDFIARASHNNMTVKQLLDVLAESREAEKSADERLVQIAAEISALTIEKTRINTNWPSCFESPEVFILNKIGLTVEADYEGA